GGLEIEGRRGYPIIGPEHARAAGPTRIVVQRRGPGDSVKIVHVVFPNLWEIKDGRKCSVVGGNERVDSTGGHVLGYPVRGKNAIIIPCHRREAAQGYRVSGCRGGIISRESAIGLRQPIFNLTG